MNKKEEIEIYRKDSDVMVAMVNSTKVSNEAEAKEIANKVKRVKELKKALEDKMNKSIFPAKQVIVEAKETYGPMIEKCIWAEKELKEKFRLYAEEAERLRTEKELKIAARVERGTMKVETAVKKIDEMPESQKSVKSDEGVTISIRKMPVAVIKEPHKIPFEFWDINIPRVNREALKRHREGIEQIPGVEIEYRTDTSSR
jgi:hypothetical protein